MTFIPTWHHIQVGDVEAAIQESFLDQFHEHVIAPATKLGGQLGRGIQNWPPPHLIGLLPILTALGRTSAAERACLGRACALLSSKHRLSGKNVIAALQEILNKTGMDCMSQSHILPDIGKRF